MKETLAGSWDDQDPAYLSQSSSVFEEDEEEYDFSFLHETSSKIEEVDESLNPPELVWPLPVVYTAPLSKAFVYALPGCFRVVCKNKKRVYTSEDGARKFYLVPSKFKTLKAAKAYADEYVHSRFSGKRKTTGNFSIASEDKENTGKYLDTVYSPHWFGHRATLHSYPGDYLSDFVYWWNQGYYRACIEVCQSVPSWARY